MGNHPTKLKAREMEHQSVPCAATPSLVGCWEGRWGCGGEVQRHPAARAGGGGALSPGHSHPRQGHGVVQRGTDF